MAGLPRYSDSDDDTDIGSDRASSTGTPLWVKVVGIIVVLVAVLLVAQYLIGGGMAGLHQ